MTGEAARPRFCLYIAGEWPNSQRARVNLEGIMADIDAALEIVDALQDPERGMRDGVFLTPTLIRIEPAPRRVIVGDLSNRLVVLGALFDRR